MTAAPNILAVLPTLPPEQLRELHARTAMLLGAGAAQPETTTDAEQQLVHEQVIRVLQNAGQTRNTPLNIVLKGKNGPAFVAGATAMLDFVEKHLQPKKRADKQKAVAVLVDVVAGWMTRRRRPIPLSHRTLCQQLVNVTTAVEDSFPGYLRSNLLPLVFKLRGDCKGS